MVDNNPKAFGTFLRDIPAVNEQAKAFISGAITGKLPDLPKEFDGRVVWKDYLSPIKNQKKCGACYAFACVGMLADRFAIQTNLAVKPDLNPLETAICMHQLYSVDEFNKLFSNTDYQNTIFREQAVKSCQGNTLYNTGRYLYIEGAVEESCVSMKFIEDYQDKNGKMPSCNEFQGKDLDLCLDGKTAQRMWNTRVYYKVGEDDIQQNINLIKAEVYKYGPIAVGFTVFEDFMTFEGKDNQVYIPGSNQKQVGGHAVRIVGWGESPSPHWIIANSWGKEWGADGYFKMTRGNPLLQLEINTVALWPNFPGQQDIRIPYYFESKIIPSDVELKHAVEALDHTTFYKVRTLEKIKKGLLKGSTDPLLDVNKLPDPVRNNWGDFWAYDVANYKRGDNKKSNGKSGNESNQGNKKSFIVEIVAVLIVLIAIAGIVYLFLRNRNN